MSVGRKIIEWIFIIVIALILSIILRKFISEVYIVEGISMEKTLHNKERIIVTKFNRKITDYHKGDIVVIDYKEEHGKEIIKRIIALPGDTLEIKDGKVYVNGLQYNEPYLKSNTEGSFEKITIPEGTLFVMGDNRAHSLDSRDSRIGPVDFTRVKGKAKFVIWPLPRIRALH